MKRNIIYKGFASLALLGTLTACSSDYLDVAPGTNIPEDVAVGSPQAARLAVDGLYIAMNKQYLSLDWNGNCGEAYVGTVLDDAIGPDHLFGLWGNFDSMGNWQILAMDRAYAAMIGWTYYYTLISEANNIINPLNQYDAKYTPETPETKAEPEIGGGSQEGDDNNTEGINEEDLKSLKFSLASALTMRAHAYQKLMGLYAPRFEDSEKGEAKTIPLRLSMAQGPDVPLAKYKEIYAQIYEDLERAIRLFGESGESRSAKSKVDANVAHGVYARAAITNHDWELAQKHASEARKGYTIMDADTYLSGFTNDCSDYIWHMDPGFETTYYMSWGSHNTSNGGYLTAWDEGAGAINIDLYNATDPKDIRRLCYVTPDKTPTSSVRNPLKLTADDWWNPEAVGATSQSCINLTVAGQAYSTVSENTSKKSNGMYDVVAWICYLYVKDNFKGDLAQYENDEKLYNYQTHSGKKSTGYVQVRKDLYVKNVKTHFGAQMKFWGNMPYGNMAYPWMRASEMALLEAEAYYEMHNETKAISCLTEVMKNRVSGYKCTKTGDALRDEIRVNRRMELFMEGHNFTDFKRWNIPAERRAWKAKDPSSGNAAPYQVMPKKMPDASRGWRWSIPFSETQYNHAIDVSELVDNTAE